MAADLENAIDTKVKPLLGQTMRRCLGITVNEIANDISDRLLKTPLVDMAVDYKLPYKTAKEVFRRWFLTKMLKLSCGNISEVSRKCGVNRRSVHRMIITHNIEIDQLRGELIKRDYVKKAAISSMIENTLKNYEHNLNSKRLEELYRNVPELSQQILESLPEEAVTLKTAETEFERQYFARLLDEKKAVAAIAKRVGLRAETVYRKIKRLNLTPLLSDKLQSP